jgi:hypothetical protein
MNERNIFNNWLELDCFCLNITEAWVKHRQKINKAVSSDEFMEWVMNDLYPALESNFDDVYEEEFENEE